MNIPSEKEIKSLHVKYASTKDVFDLVYTHCNIVWLVAEQLYLANSIDVDIQLVKAGCLLHDIGVYQLFDKTGNERTDIQYVTHGILGEEILRAEGFDESLWRIGSHHTGAGISKEQIQKLSLPLPPRDFMADSTEEALVMYADKFHSKTDPPYFNSLEWYKDYAKRFGEDVVERFELLSKQFGIPNLEDLSKLYNQPIR